MNKKAAKNLAGWIAIGAVFVALALEPAWLSLILVTVAVIAIAALMGGEDWE